MTIATPVALLVGAVAGWFARSSIRPARPRRTAEEMLADLRAAVPSADLRIERSGRGCKTIVNTHDGRITLVLGDCDAPDADAHEALHAVCALARNGHEEPAVRAATKWVVS